jgi:hypothetical protein
MSPGPLGAWSTHFSFGDLSKAACAFDSATAASRFASK